MSGVEDPQRPPRLVLDDPASGDFSQTQRTPSILQAEEADDEIIDGGGDELVAGAALGDAGAGVVGCGLGEEPPADEEPGMREHPAREPAPRSARSTGRRLTWCCGNSLGAMGLGGSPAPGAAGR